MFVRYAFAFSRRGSRPSCCENRPLKSEEGAGKAGCPPHPWSARNKKSTRQNHRCSRDHPAFPAQWFYSLYVLFPVTFAWLPPSPARRVSILAALAPALERQNDTTSPSASGHVRLTCPPRPPHPHLTYRDDRPKRPSSSRRDAREHRCDLPDDTSADACDTMARRAICAWQVCE